MAGPQPRGGRPSSGIPDWLFLVGLLVILAVPGSVWLATGAGAWVEHGSWPPIGFSDTATAIRQLGGHPGDIPAAWPSAPKAELPSTALFYGAYAAILVLLAAAVIGLLSLRRFWRATHIRTTAEEPDRTVLDRARRWDETGDPWGPGPRPGDGRDPWDQTQSRS